ncbi:class I SAM-dependent methyltransferase [Azospirillum sp. Marseille-Q6669]
MSPAAPAACILCGCVAHDRLAEFTAPPPGETNFGIIDYRRVLWRCRGCGHVVNRYGFDLASRLYEGAYAAATYGDGMRQTFARIMALPPSRSDNRQRVARIQRFAEESGLGGDRSVLDVGSGLGVFPAAIREAGWRCTALDPDPRACAMIAELAGVATVCGDFTTLDLTERYDAVTFNKVLEHVELMIPMLARARDRLAAGGFVYVELPDGEAALAEGPDREEFFIEHHCAFSMASFALLARKAGLRALCLERLREPSGKYTLRGFLVPAESGVS